MISGVRRLMRFFGLADTPLAGGWESVDIPLFSPERGESQGRASTWWWADFEFSGSPRFSKIVEVGGFESRVMFETEAKHAVKSDVRAPDQAHGKERRGAGKVSH